MKGALVVDTSALIAAAFAEPQRDAVLAALSEAGAVRMSAACLLEGSIVALARLGPQGQAEFALLLDAFGVEVVVAARRSWPTLATEALGALGQGRGTRQDSTSSTAAPTQVLAQR